MIMPKKTVKVYPNNKPWVSKSLKRKEEKKERKKLNKKKIAFRAKDQLEWTRVQSKFRKEIREAKKQYTENSVSNWQYA